MPPKFQIKTLGGIQKNFLEKSSDKEIFFPPPWGKTSFFFFFSNFYKKKNSPLSFLPKKPQTLRLCHSVQKMAPKDTPPPPLQVPKPFPPPENPKNKLFLAIHFHAHKDQIFPPRVFGMKKIINGFLKILKKFFPHFSLGKKKTPKKERLFSPKRCFKKI